MARKELIEPGVEAVLERVGVSPNSLGLIEAQPDRQWIGDRTVIVSREGGLRRDRPSVESDKSLTDAPFSRTGLRSTSS